MCKRKKSSFVFLYNLGYLTGSQLCTSSDNKEILSTWVSVIGMHPLASDLRGDIDQMKQQISYIVFMQVLGWAGKKSMRHLATPVDCKEPNINAAAARLLPTVEENKLFWKTATTTLLLRLPVLSQCYVNCRRRDSERQAWPWAEERAAKGLHSHVPQCRWRSTTLSGTYVNLCLKFKPTRALRQRTAYFLDYSLG